MSRPAGGDSLEARLEVHVRTLAEPRHWRTSGAGLRRAQAYVEEQLGTLGLEVGRQAFRFRDEAFENLVATAPASSDASAPRLLVGAHLDTVSGSPGANDNGSGLAGLIEVARALSAEPTSIPVDLVAFHLEEWQGTTYRVGSRRFVRWAKRQRRRYAGAIVYDMIGYRRTEAGSQIIPRIVTWMGFPTVGDFIAVLGDGRSRHLVDAFRHGASTAAPDLPVVTLAVPLRGWPVWHTRRSDNASFWAAGIPSVMVTDTGNLRNPHYHRATDRPETLDYGFMASVVSATVQSLRDLAASLTT